MAPSLALFLAAGCLWLAGDLTEAAGITSWVAAGWVAAGLAIVAAASAAALWDRWRGRSRGRR